MAFIILQSKECGIRSENFVVLMGHVQMIKEFYQMRNTCLMTSFM